MKSASERETDAVADEVMRTGVEEKVQRTKKEESNIKPAALSMVNQATRSHGKSMDKSTRYFMENRMVYDFSNVKIHTGQNAARSAQSINALAYTSGHNIVFNEGQYAPTTDSGKRLLAHELTHVIQQTGSQRNPGVVQAKRALSPKESRKCLEKVENAIKKLEASSKDKKRKLPDYIVKAIKLLRQRKDNGKIKCYAFDGITHGTVDFEKEEIHVDGVSEGWINETTLLHEGVHALHGKEYNKAARNYQKAKGKEIDLNNPSKADLELLKFKAWTEYWAYRSRLEYHNQTRQTPFTEDEIDEMSISHREVRIAVNRVRPHDSKFHPKTWTPKK